LHGRIIPGRGKPEQGTLGGQIVGESCVQPDQGF
jgi:hypothetical protein